MAMRVFLLFSILVPLLACSPHAQDEAESVSLSVDEIYGRVASVRSVELDRDVTATVAYGRGLRLDCAANGVGIAAVVICFAEDGQVWIAARDTDGYAIERSSSRYRKVDALLYQLGRTPVLVVARWTWSEDGAALTIRVSTDLAFNAERRAWARARRSEGANTAILFRNSAPVAAAELSEDERVAGFCRLWSEVKYNFAFFDQVPELDWDSVLLETLPAVRAARTAPEYYAVLERCVARLRDGHTSVYGPGVGVRGDARLPLTLAFDSEGKLRIDRVVALEDVKGEEMRGEIEAAALRRGAVITHWDGRPVEQLLDDEVRPRICASTPQSRDVEAAIRLSAGEYGSRVALRVLDVGAETAREVVLRRARYPVARSGTDRFVVRELERGVLYVNLPSFGSRQVVEQFEQELPRIRAARALILDVRANGGGNSSHGWSIVSHLIDAPIPTTAWRTRMHRPAFRAWGRAPEWHRGEPGRIQAASDPFLGPVAVLTGPRTFSAAEDFVAVLHAAARATVVGRPTAGSTGQPMRIELPGGGGARICTKRDAYPDGREFVGVGILPDVVVDPLLTPERDDPELARALRVVLAAL